MARAARCRSRRGGSSRALQGRSNTSAHIWGEIEKRRVNPRARAAGRGPSQERRTHPRAAGLARPGERLRAAPARRSSMRPAARPGHAPPPSRLGCSRAPPAGRSAHRCSPSASLCSRGPAVAPRAACFSAPSHGGAEARVSTVCREQPPPSHPHRARVPRETALNTSTCCETFTILRAASIRALVARSRQRS